MGLNSAFKELKIFKNPGNGRLNNLNDPVLNVLKKWEDTLIWRRKLWIALCGELALEEALDLS